MLTARDNPFLQPYLYEARGTNYIGLFVSEFRELGVYYFCLPSRVI